MGIIKTKLDARLTIRGKVADLFEASFPPKTKRPQLEKASFDGLSSCPEKKSYEIVLYSNLFSPVKVVCLLN